VNEKWVGKIDEIYSNKSPHLRNGAR